MRTKERVVYDNYDLWQTYAEDCKEYLLEYYPDEEVTENALWDEIYRQDKFNWEDEFYQLKEFFKNKALLAVGTVGAWNGVFDGGIITDGFENLFYKLAEGCAYWKIWDENGHLYINCSHHDGTNFAEIKIINNRATEIIDNWMYSYNDDRTEADIHDTLFNCNLYSKLPHYAHTIYGCKKREG